MFNEKSKRKNRIENDDGKMVVYPEEMLITTATNDTEQCPVCYEDMAVNTKIVNLSCLQTHFICSIVP